MNKWLLGFLLVLLVVIIYYLVGYYILQKETVLTEEQATDFALQELRFRYQNASIEVFEVKNMSTVAGQTSWLVKANVVYGASTLCPNLTIVEVDQGFSFVPREKDIITEGCRVLGCRDRPLCSINYPEEAILIPLDPDHNPGIQANLSQYILSAGGAASIQTAAARYADKFTSHTNATYSDVWVVRYTYQDAPNYFEVVLNKSSGTALEYYVIPQ